MTTMQYKIYNAFYYDIIAKIFSNNLTSLDVLQKYHPTCSADETELSVPATET